MKEKSEFGCGLTYCIGLFLCHAERDYLMTENDVERGIINKPSLWFYAAADHLFDLQIPRFLPKELKERIRKWKSKVIGWRLPMTVEGHSTQEDKIWAINEAKELLRLIDEHFKIKTCKGDFL